MRWSGSRCSTSSRRRGSPSGSSSSSSRSSSAPSTGRRGCGARRRRSGSSSRKPSTTRRCPTGPRMTGIAPADVRAALRGQRFGVREAEIDGVAFLYGDRHRWTKLATLFTHLGPDPVPRRGRRDVAARRRAGPRHRRGRFADGPADRDARPARREELRASRRPGFLETGQRDRLHDRPRRVPERPGGRAQDDPGRTTRSRSAATRSTRTDSGRRRTS